MFRTRREQVRVINLSTALSVCEQADVADHPLSRLIGLLGRSSLQVGYGMWIIPSSSIHTFGMSFPIDVVAISKDNRVVGVYRNLCPWRIAVFARATQSVLELPGGQIDLARVAIGDQLAITTILGS